MRRYGLLILGLLLWALPAEAQGPFGPYNLSGGGSSCATAGACTQNVPTFNKAGLTVEIVDPSAGTWTALLECTASGQNYTTRTVVLTSDTSPSELASFASGGTYQANVAGTSNCRVRLSAYTSGAPRVWMGVADGSSTVNSAGAGGGGGGTLQDDDDGSIAGGQNADVSIGLLQLWSGSAWVRALGGSGVEAAGVLRTTEATDSSLNVAVAAIQSAAESTLTEIQDLNGKVNQDVAHDNAASSTGPQVMVEAKDFDGSALPNTVSAEGDAVRPAASLSGVPYVMLTNETGSVSPIDQTTGRMRASSLCQDDSLVTSVPISTATSGNVELVALSGSTVIYVCGFDVVAAGTVNVQFITGTGTACATGETDKTGTYQLTAQTGLVRSNGGAVQFKGAAGQAACIELSGAVQIDGLFTYVQQ